MSENKKIKIEETKGKLGVLIPGMGAVATTFIAGVIAIKNKLAEPIGSFTQTGNIRLGKRTENRNFLVKDFIPIENIENIVFGGWEIEEINCYERAIKCGVLEKSLLDSIKDELEQIKPYKAVFNQQYVKKLNGTFIKEGKNWMDLSDQVAADIEDFKKKNNLDRVVMIWCGSTEIYMEETEIHNSIVSLEKAMKENHKGISPSMVYAYTAIKMGIPYANGAPNLSADIPALEELATKTKTPISGKDFKTGQTLMKTIIAPGLKARNLRVDGWFSTNILGNRDGEVLDDAESFKTKEVSKLSVLGSILGYEPYHKVRINYYPPRGDNKEGWDNIDFSGFLGYPMQIKIDFLCRDSILAAPICLDLVLLLDFANRAGMRGIQEWLGFFFKSPQHSREIYPEHDIFIQLLKLKNTLRFVMGEDLIHHLGLEYYPETYSYLMKQIED